MSINIIGASVNRPLIHTSDLYELIEEYVNIPNRTLKLYVYNIREATCREVAIKPDPNW